MRMARATLKPNCAPDAAAASATCDAAAASATRATLMGALNIPHEEQNPKARLLRAPSSLSLPTKSK